MILSGLIDEKDIDAAHCHVQKSLEKVEDPAAVSKGGAKKRKSGFIVSLDGKTLFPDGKTDSNEGETVDFCDHDVCAE